jgi:hypothetical protein
MTEKAKEQVATGEDSKPPSPGSLDQVQEIAV